jgi:sugar phosphate permease
VPVQFPVRDPRLHRGVWFNNFQITTMLAWWSVAYGVGQLVNGLFCDRIGGRASMVIGAVGTVGINFIYGFAPLPAPSQRLL